MPWGFRRPAEIDLPRRRSVDVSVCSEAVDISNHLKINSDDPEYSSVKVSRRQREVDHMDVGVNQSESGRGNKRDLPRMPWATQNPAVIDLPRRRSVDLPVCFEVADASGHLKMNSWGPENYGGKVSRGQRGVDHNQSESNKGRKIDLPRMPWVPQNPTIVDLPCRWSVDASVCFDAADPGNHIKTISRKPESPDAKVS